MRMSQIEVERFLGRLITDADFRLKSSSSLVNAINNEGFTISGMELSLLANIDFALLGRVSETISDSLQRK